MRDGGGPRIMYYNTNAVLIKIYIYMLVPMWKTCQYTYWHANMHTGFNMHTGIIFLPICILAVPICILARNCQYQCGKRASMHIGFRDYVPICILAVPVCILARTTYTNMHMGILYNANMHIGSANMIILITTRIITIIVVL